MGNAFLAPGHLGIEAIRDFVLRAMEISRLDRNGDGSITPDEYGLAIVGLLPTILNLKQVVAEGRDLSADEVSDLLRIVSANFPEYRKLPERVRNVIVESLSFASVTTAASKRLFDAIRALKEPEDAVEDGEDVVVNTAAKKQKISGGVPADPESPSIVIGEGELEAGEGESTELVDPTEPTE